jgi:membrane associated rhomboid family serine protease
MSTTTPPRRRGQLQLGGLELLAGMVALMWLLEVINSLDGNRLDGDGIYARNVGHLWGIFTAPFLHVSFAHLIANTIPFVFMGVIIALEGAKRLALVTLIVIVVGGIGTWLISPSHTGVAPVVTVGASGVVFGYATYLFTRGIFNRSVVEILVGGIVGVVWGGALLASIVPHYGVSWQDHASGAIGGVVAAWLLSRERRSASAQGAPGSAGTVATRL